MSFELLVKENCHSVNFQYQSHIAPFCNYNGIKAFLKIVITAHVAVTIRCSGVAVFSQHSKHLFFGPEINFLALTSPLLIISKFSLTKTSFHTKNITQSKLSDEPTLVPSYIANTARKHDILLVYWKFSKQNHMAKEVCYPSWIMRETQKVRMRLKPEEP